MADTLRQVRRAATEWGVRGLLALSAVLPMSAQQWAVRTIIGIAGAAPGLRAWVLRNMRLALGDDVPASAAREWVRNVSLAMSTMVVTFHRGFRAAGVLDKVCFDDSIAVLDAAVAGGRGAVLIASHLAGHEMVAAAINQRHPMAMLVRRSPKPAEMARKLKWYNALGAELVLRPSGPTTMKDAVDYVRVLRGGKTIAITPDLLAAPHEGAPVTIFGRPARLHVGAFALSMLAKAPMVRVSGRLQADGRVLVSFERAPDIAGADREAAVGAALQDWCRWFETKLRSDPAGWMFWVDKRWSRFLRDTPRERV
ncbi:MAG TPA: lysophospholipid acyltransferase family protein [Caulobacteraceae bacterium]|jgi:lauroyl/myristoyl acyltransferase